MSENQDKVSRNINQKPEVREPDTLLPGDYQNFEDEEVDDDGAAYAFDDAAEDSDDDYYEDDDQEDPAALDPYAMAQQLMSSPLFAQMQTLLGGSGSVAARMTTAQMQQAAGNLEGAAEIYLDIIEEDPDNQKAHVGLGQTLLMMDQPEKAETFLVKATELDPEDATAQLYLGYAYYAQQAYAKGVVAFQQTVTLDPDSHVAWNNLGYSQYLNRQLAEAEKTFVKAGDVGSNRAYYNLGMVRILQGCAESTIEQAYQDADDLDPNGSQIEDHIGDLEGAKTLYPDRVARLDQEIERFNSLLGEYEEEEDDEEEEEDEYAPKD